MCGILGLLNKNQPVNPNLFSRMLSKLTQRGPDQSGQYFDRNFALGHRRLSIMDLSDAGKQPMTNENGQVVISYNGEIYNYQDLKQGLSQKHVWKSQTDTETIIHGYEEQGKNIVSQLEGMFALAIYDKKQNQIILARDHLGKKPLYYYSDENIFCFASELKALVSYSEIKKRLSLSQNSINQFLAFGYIPSPNSIFYQIKKLPPASFLVFEIDAWQMTSPERFWSLGNLPLQRQITEFEAVEKIEFLLNAAVQKRLMADVPVGLFLSGGVDSSLLAHFFAQNHNQPQAFTIAYKNPGQEDETKYAIEIAKTAGISYNLNYLAGQDIQTAFIEMLDYLDEPLADAAIFPLYHLAQQARQKITVALSGDGADEIFAGYPKYQAEYWLEKIQFLAYALKFLKPWLKSQSALKKFADTVDFRFHERHLLWGSGGFLPNELVKINKNGVDKDCLFHQAETIAKEYQDTDIINQSLYLDTKLLLADGYLAKCDRATMAASLELRNPFLDKNLVELAFSLPGKMKWQNTCSKYLLKKIAAKHFKKEIIYRPKQGFGVPLNQWIEGDLKDIFYEYLFVDNGYWNIDYVQQLAKEHMIEKKHNHQFKLLRIVIFNYFIKSYNE